MVKDKESFDEKMHRSRVWYLRRMQHLATKGDFFDIFGFWFTALRSPAAARQVGVTFDDLMRAAQGYAATVQRRAAQGDFTAAEGLRAFVNNRYFPITWHQVGLTEATVCSWIEKCIRQLSAALGNDHERACRIVELLYYYPDTRKVLSDRQVDQAIRVTVRWARELYRTIKQPALKPAEGRLLSLELLGFLTIQLERENELKAPVNLEIQQLCDFTWQDVYNRHEFWKARDK